MTRLIFVAAVLVALLATAVSASSLGGGGLPHLQCSAFYSAISTCSEGNLNLQQHMASWCDDCVLNMPKRDMGLKSHPWAAAAGLWGVDTSDPTMIAALKGRAPGRLQNLAFGLGSERAAAAPQPPLQRANQWSVADKLSDLPSFRQHLARRSAPEPAAASLEQRFDDGDFDESDCLGSDLFHYDDEYRRRAVNENAPQQARFTAEEAAAALHEKAVTRTKRSSPTLPEERSESRCALWFTNRATKTGCFQQVIAYHTQGAHGLSYNFTNADSVTDNERCTRHFNAPLEVVDPLQRGVSVVTSPYAGRSIVLDKCQSNMDWAHCCFQMKSLPMFATWEYMAGPGWQLNL